MARKGKIKVVEKKKPISRRRRIYEQEKSNHGVLRRTTFIMVLCGVLLFIPLLVQLFQLMILVAIAATVGFPASVSIFMPRDLRAFMYISSSPGSGSAIALS